MTDTGWQSYRGRCRDAAATAVCTYVYAWYYRLLSLIYESCDTIFFFGRPRVFIRPNGIDQKCRVLVLFFVVHAGGNLHVFKGPDDFDGYDYFYGPFSIGQVSNFRPTLSRSTCCGEHCCTFVVLKRTWDQKLSSGLKSGQLILANTGLMLLTFMITHLWQFHFADIEQYFL